MGSIFLIRTFIYWFLSLYPRQLWRIEVFRIILVYYLPLTHLFSPIDFRFLIPPIDFLFVFNSAFSFSSWLISSSIPDFRFISSSLQPFSSSLADWFRRYCVTQWALRRERGKVANQTKLNSLIYETKLLLFFFIFIFFWVYYMRKEPEGHEILGIWTLVFFKYVL